ncbi:MAG: phasin family protein [Phyllobacterium sp.]|uniref:phasin family protein n=1 Tax=Phyllobacterium sp. TaxID=1871046 RepID=UPI0030F19EAF
MSYQVESQQTSAAIGSVPFGHVAQSLVRACTHVQAHALKGIIRAQIEGLAFAKHRYERNLKLIDDLIASEKYQNTFGVYGEFYRDAASEYAEEMRKLTSLGSRLVSDSAELVDGEVDKVFEDAAARTIGP